MHFLLQLEMQSLMEKLSHPATYHILIYIAFGFNLMPVAFHHLFMLIAARETQYWCLAPNGTVAAWQNESIVNATAQDRECYFYDEATLKSRGECSKWMYSLERKNVISEFNLVCKESWLPELATSIYFLGAAAGGLVGLLADDFGRKLLMLICVLASIFLGVGVYFSHIYILFVLFRTIQGFLASGAQVCLMVLMLESIPTRMRNNCASFIGIFWVAGFLVMLLLDFLIQNWKFLELAVALPSVFALAGVWCLPESVSWMVSKFKLKQADQELMKIAKFNKLICDDNPLSTMVTPDNPNDPMTFSIEDLRGGTKLQTPRLRRHKIVMVFVWFCVWFTYFGLTFNPVPVTNNKYYDLIIDLGMDLPFLCIAPFAVITFGSRNTTFVCMIVAAAFNITAALIPDISPVNQETIGWIRYTFVLIGKMVTASVMFMLYRYSAELFHTQQRASSIGGFTSGGAVGAAAAILIHKLVVSSTTVQFQLVYLIYAGLLLVASLLCRCLLPDTNARNNLPETIQDAEFVGAKPRQIRQAKFKGDTSTIEDNDTAYLQEDDGVLSNDNFSFGKRALGSDVGSDIVGLYSIRELGHQAEVGHEIAGPSSRRLENILNYGTPTPGFENPEYGKINYVNPAYATDERLVTGGANYTRIDDIILADTSALQGNVNPNEGRNTEGDSKASKDTVQLNQSADSGFPSSRGHNGTLPSIRVNFDEKGEQDRDRSSIFVATSEQGVGTEYSSIFVDATNEAESV
ncbi:solute carrier family 22 member 7-like [Lineus longissimus]|uniref:solute carrier family 22 member 7-like n=1 Tax=Lineus longissimus TaxID=88925 RepID=UPI002B4D59FF